MQVVNLVKGLDRAEFEPHLLYYDSGDALSAKLDASQVHLHRLQKRSRFDLRMISAIAQLIDEHEIDVVHCTIQYSLLLAWAARLKSRKKPPLICAIHTTENQTTVAEVADRFVYRGLFRACQALIFVCRSQLEHWLKRYPELGARSYVVYNGINTEIFDPAVAVDQDETRILLGIPDGAIVVSCVAAFRPEKGHDLLLNAFAQVVTELPHAYLVLAGDGPTREDMEELAWHLAIDNHVRFSGAIDDIRGLLAISEVTVLASTAVETFSIAMLESMAMGVPMVATNMGGMREAVLDGKTGLLIEPNDVASLGNGLLRLLQNESFRGDLGRNARELVLNEFTEKKMIRGTEKILSTVVARRRRALNPTIDSSRPVFIIGGARTGSEMLKTMLATSRELDFVDEMFLLCPRWLHRDLHSNIRRRVGKLTDAGARDRLVEFLYSGIPEGWFWSGKLPKMDRDLLLEELSRDDLSLKSIFKAIMTEHARMNGKDGMGAKFPVHYSYAKRLLDWFPNCRLIHTTRNPKATYASQAAKYTRKDRGGWINAYTRFQHFVHINIQISWTAHVHRQMVGLPNYRLVRYEDVVVKPEEELRGICEFLEVDFVPEMLNPHQYGSSFDTIGQRSGVDGSSLDRWRQTLWPLTAQFIDLAHPTARKTFGY